MTSNYDNLQAQMEEQLRFDMVLAEISTKFINLPAGEVDGEIENAQRRVCECLRLDMAGLWQWSAENSGMYTLTHLYRPLGGPPFPEQMDGREYFPWCEQQIMAGKVIAISTEDLPEEAARDQEVFRYFGVKSNLTFPLIAGEEPPFGALGFNAVREERTWPEELLQRLQLVAQIFTNALARKRSDRAIQELKQRLEGDCIYLQEEVKDLLEHSEVVGRSDSMISVLRQAEQVALTDSTVLILGETGTGKELLARVIHSLSSRKDRPLITVNCASLPASVIENELFGREKGAYTGALTKMQGRFEIADGSTILLDEIGELPLDVQAKLLRVIEEGTFERLGSTKSIQANVRVIASTNRDLDCEVKEGRFRQDLFFRLNVFPIRIPPIRERLEDIPPLLWMFVKRFNKKMGKNIVRVPDSVMKILKAYSWPGNVREIRNVIERAMIVSKGTALQVNLPETEAPDTTIGLSLEEVERRHIESVLKNTAWRVTGIGGAADVLGLKGTTLQSKMKKLGIVRPHVLPK